jgi:hypothetical protein
MDEADWPAYRRSVLENIAELSSQLRSTRDEMGRLRDELIGLRLDVAAIKVKMGVLSLIGGSALTLVVGYMINKLLT